MTTHNISTGTTVTNDGPVTAIHEVVGTDGTPINLCFEHTRQGLVVKATTADGYTISHKQVDLDSLIDDMGL